MPELPEVEAVCRRLQRQAKGARIVSAHLLRKRDRKLENGVRGRTIARVERVGKNILLHLTDNIVLRIHLRMTGNLYVLPKGSDRPATVRAYFELEDGSSLVFDDRRALGIVQLLQETGLKKLRDEAGIEPLSDQFTKDVFLALARRSRAPAKLFLMNQARVAGLGNLYTAEVLHRARVHPSSPINRLSARRIETIRSAIVSVLTEAVKSAVKAYSKPGRFDAGETFQLAVYGREGEPCPVCETLVRRMAQGGRSTYYCPRCQR